MIFQDIIEINICVKTNIFCAELQFDTFIAKKDITIENTCILIIKHKQGYEMCNADKILND